MPVHLPSHEELGIMHELPGLEIAIDSLVRRREELLGKLRELQAGAHAVEKPQPKVVLQLAAAGAKLKSGWPADPAERSREMKRRQAVRAAKLADAPKHPRDPNHPGHERWVRKIRRGRRAAWDSMTTREQQEQIARMQAGKRS